jgi:hypothetical protein
MAYRISDSIFIIAWLEGDDWEANLKDLAATDPLQDWLQLARDIKAGKFQITRESWLLRTRIQILLVDAGRITDEAYIAAVTAE